MAELLRTVAVHVRLRGPSGANARIAAKLNRYEIDDGFVVPDTVHGETDAQGRATLDLWPNARGSRSSLWTITVTGADYRELIRGTIAIPDVPGPLALKDYLDSPPYPERPVYQDALIRMGALADSASTDAETADRRARDAEESARNASESDRSASMSANKASDSQTSASDSAATAGQHAASAAQEAKTSEKHATESKSSAAEAGEAAATASQAATTSQQSSDTSVAAADRAEYAAAQTEGLTSWASDGATLSAQLPIGPPAIISSDLPSAVQPGSFCWVPDLGARGALAVYSDTWRAVGTGTLALDPIQRYFRDRDWRGLYIRGDKPSLIYSDVGLSMPVGADNTAVAAIRDLSGNGVDVSQATASSQPYWTGSHVRADGVDDVLTATTDLRYGVGQPLFVMIGYSDLAGNDPFDGLFSLSNGSASVGYGVRTDIEISYPYLRTADGGIANDYLGQDRGAARNQRAGGPHTIALVVEADGQYAGFVDGEKMVSHSATPDTSVSDPLGLRIYNGSSQTFDLLGFVAAQAAPTDDEVRIMHETVIGGADES